MKEQVKLPVVIVAVAAIVAAVVYFGSKAMSTGDLDQGQVKYTPGKPPWEESDASKKGPGGAPGGADMNGRGPAGMAPPKVGN